MKKFKILAILIFVTTLLTQPKTNAVAQTDIPQFPVYIVQPGDSINVIALKFNVDPQDLMDANGITDANFLQVNAQLLIPGVSGMDGYLAFHPVELGETSFEIARKYQLDLTSLYKMNRVTSPSEFYLGSNIIYSTVSLDGNDETILNKIDTIENGNEIESAIINQTNKWSLFNDNNIKYSWQFSPNENYFTSIKNNTSQEASIVFNGLPLTQGKTASIRIPQIKEVSSARLAEYQLHFNQIGDDFVAIFGIHTFHDAGLYPIHIEYVTNSGNKNTIDQLIIIQKGFYAQDPILYVDATTIDPAITVPENELLFSTTTPITLTKYWDGLFSYPVDEPICIKAWFGNSRAYNDGPYDSFHTGVDFGVCANLNIYAPAPGKVVYTGPLTIRGNATIIDHGLGVYTGYWHQETILVNVGDVVEQGQLIGTIGSTGRSTGPHLHWEVIANGVQVDGLDWLDYAFP